ncbi:ribose-phosphate pyrophosphokinase [Fructilactobacillus fructivorans]|nr:ribose-phosphate pyrophosphokinase [Fructilactobacillus fructivorans]KRN39582.1 ribose-phosphate pyrophosphokinase [Fructilactobacillus fructivorans]
MVKTKKEDRSAKIFALNSNRPLAEKISEASGMDIGKATINHFSDGEIQITINESIRGDDVYIVQSLSDPVNDNLMELMIMIDAVRRTSPNTINVVIPYYGYSRSDRKARSREPITAKLIATFLESSAVDWVVTLDLHAAQIQGFFDIPVDHLRSLELMGNYLKEHDVSDDAVVVSPDYNSVAKARGMAGYLNLPIAIVDNRDPEDYSKVPSTIIGDVKGKNAIVVDDMIVTGDKMKTTAKAIMNAGAKAVYVVATHPVLTEDAKKNLSDPAIKQVIVSDSIVVPQDKKIDKMVIVSVGKLIGNALKLIENEQSTSKLFD